MSAHLIVPSKDEVQRDSLPWNPETSAIVPVPAGPVGTKSQNRLLGILGLIVVGAILGLTIYSMVKYLL